MLYGILSSDTPSCSKKLLALALFSIWKSQGKREKKREYNYRYMRKLKEKMNDRSLLTKQSQIDNIVHIQQVHYWREEIILNIIISNNRDKPIYEQIVSQIKNMIMSEELLAGDSLPSMRSLAKSIHVSVITVQRAYEELQRDGFIETEIGRGTYVLARNKEFYKEQQQKRIEEYLQLAIDAAKENAVPLEKLIDLLKILYLEE